jgi:hypothetical protein
MNNRLLPFIAFCLFAMMVAVAFQARGNGPGPIPFNPSFVTGSGATNCNPTNQLCMNTTTSPYGAYVWNPTASSWEQYGGGSSGSSCSGTAGDILYTSTGSNCIGATLQWNGAQLVWASNGRVDDPGDLDTTGSFDMIFSGWSVNSAGAINISTSSGDANFGSSNNDVNIDAFSGTVFLAGLQIELNGTVIGGLATCNIGGSSGEVQTNNGSGCPNGITNAQLTALINNFTTSLSGAAPASGGGTTNFLRADGTWTVPSGSTTPPGGSPGQVQYNNSGSFGGLTNTQLTADINAFTSSLSGAAPASGGGTANFLRADGTWDAPAGSSTIIFTPPLAADFTPFTGDLTLPVLTNQTYGLVVDFGLSVSTANLRGAMEATPGTPWQWNVGIAVTINDYEYRSAGICISDGIKYEVEWYVGKNAGPEELNIAQWTTSAVFSTVAASAGGPRYRYLGVSDDGTNINWLVSMDGNNFVSVYTEPVGSFITPTQVGFCAQPNYAGGPTVDHVYDTITYTNF